MGTTGGKLLRIVGIGTSWAIVWLGAWAAIGTGLELTHPGSVDPGEPSAMLIVLGSMGLLAGIAFGALLVIASRSGPDVLGATWRVAGLGTLATAIVQIGYLGHGELGIWANLQMAAAFSLVGGLVTFPWLAAARAWSRRHGVLPRVSAE